MSGIIGGVRSKPGIIGQKTSVDTVVMSGQVGSSSTQTGDVLISFDDFWSDRGGIVYTSGTKRFTVPMTGVYRITLNPMVTTSSHARIRVGIDTDTPNATTHKGTCYKANSQYDTLSINTTTLIQANSYIVFRLEQGAIYNDTNDRFTQFSIQLIS